MLRKLKTATTPRLLADKLADEHFQLHSRRCLRSFDGKIGGSNALNAAREVAGFGAAGGGEKFLALTVRHLDEPEDLFFRRAPRHQLFGEGEPVVVAGDEADEHHRLRAVIE